jgi:glycosyltransferase involved in cell wall biosynthesis
MYEKSKDDVMLSGNPRTKALRELLLNSPQHECVVLNISRSMRSECYGINPKMVFYDVPATRLGWIFYSLAFAVLSRPRLTISFNLEMTAIASLASIVNKSKVISVLGGDIDYVNKHYKIPKPFSALSNAIVSFSLRRANRIFVPNSHVLGTAKRITGSLTKISEFKYQVSDAFVPSMSREQRDLKSPIILTVARLSPVKGLEYLAIAAKQVLEVIPEATFLIQSPSPNPVYQSRLEAIMTKVGARGHFRFNTQGLPNNEMPKLYNSADLFVLPSLSEGRNSAVLEALACGLPVVATRVGANAEVVVNNKNGFIVDPKDASALAESIIRILTDRDLWLKLSLEARASSAWSPEYDLGTMLTEATSAVN